MAMSFPNQALSANPQDYLPPAIPWHGASEALVAKPDNPWITPAEKTQLLDSPNYEETVEYLKKLCAESAWMELQTFGSTAQGRLLYIVIATKEKTFNASTVRAGNKPTLLAQAGIHSGEIEGKDAGLMLLRDIAFGGKDALLNHANLLFIPILNADGHERSSEWNRPHQRGPVHMGWRTTAQNLNLNRDYVKADSPEMRSLVTLINTWQPHLYLDIHTTDGIDYQYDITYTYHGARGSEAWSPRGGAWLDQIFHPAVTNALHSQGHLPINLYIQTRDSPDLTKGLSTGHSMPRFSTGYGDIRRLPTVLVETHSLKPYRRRVLGTYVLLEAALKSVGREGKALRAAIAQDQRSRAPELVLGWTDSEQKHEIDFLGIESETYTSAASGGREVRWTGRPKVFPKLPVYVDKPSLRIKRPAAYWVPVSKPEVIDRLKLHGIQFETFTTGRTVSLEMYRLVDPQPQPGEGTHPFEGRHTLRTRVRAEAHKEHFPAGSVRVPTDQPLGDLAMAMLEPECLDSLFAWGFFPEILQRTEDIDGYVAAPMAERMLAEDSKLKAEFEALLAADAKFATNPAARLHWFYARSPFYDARHLLYPVGIER
jgi:hypothetical protein